MALALAAVTLDAAGTLIEPAEPVGTTYARLAARHGIALDPAALQESFHAAFAAAPPLAFPGASPARLPDHERAWWYAVVRHAFGAAAGAPGFDPCFAALFAHYGEPAAWRTFAEVRSALTALRARGLKLAVVSNFDGRLPGVLAGLGLASLVHAVIHSSRVGAAKPDPRIFHHALDALGVAPAAALHAGDDVIADVEGPRAAGMRAALVDRRGRRPPLPPDVPAIANLGALLDQQ